MEYIRNLLKFANPLGGAGKIIKKNQGGKSGGEKLLFSYEHSYTIIIIDKHYKAPEEARPKIHVCTDNIIQFSKPNLT